MKALRSFELSVTICQSTRRNVQEDLSSKHSLLRFNVSTIIFKDVTRQAMYVWGSTEAPLVQPLLHWKSNKVHVFHVLSVCVCVCVCVCVFVVLNVPHAPYCLSSVVRPALQCFPTLSHKRHDLKKTLLNNKCVFWFSLHLLLETFLILRRAELAMIKNVYRSSCNVPAIRVRF